MKITATKPSQHDRAFLLCADQNFLPFALALCSQIIDTHPEMAADICIVSETPITPPASLAHLPIRYCQIEIDKGAVNYPVTASLTFASYLRLFAFNALAGDYDRIVYLDCDFYHNGGDITGLLDIVLREGTAFGAVRDPLQYENLMAETVEMQRADVPAFPYCNTGLLVVDTAEWLKQDLLARAITQISRHPGALPLADQSALNLATAGQWSELHWHWNFMYRTSYFILLWATKPTFIHFSGPEKPWHIEGMFAPKKALRWYSSFLYEHFPDLAPSRTVSDAPKRRFQYLRLLNQNRRVIERMLPYRRRVRRYFDVMNPFE